MPVVAGIYWSRATKEGAASAMIGGLLVCFGWELWGTVNIDPVLPGFLASALLLVAVQFADAASSGVGPRPLSTLGSVQEWGVILARALRGLERRFPKALEHELVLRAPCSASRRLFRGIA